MKFFAFLALLTCSLPALAQDGPPPYIQFMQLADEYAVLASSIRTCGSFGYVVDEGEASEIGENLVETGVVNGIDVQFARRLVFQAIEQENANMAYLESRVDEASLAEVDEYIDFWIDRCDVLVDNRDFPGAVLPPAD